MTTHLPLILAGEVFCKISAMLRLELMEFVIGGNDFDHLPDVSFMNALFTYTGVGTQRELTLVVGERKLKLDVNLLKGLVELLLPIAIYVKKLIRMEGMITEEVNGLVETVRAFAGGKKRKDLDRDPNFLVSDTILVDNKGLSNKIFKRIGRYVYGKSAGCGSLRCAMVLYSMDAVERIRFASEVIIFYQEYIQSKAYIL